MTEVMGRVKINMVKAAYKSTVNTMLHGGKSQSVPTKTENKTMVSTHSTSINIVLNIFARTIKQRIQVRKEVKLSLFSDYMVLYIRHPKRSIKN